MWSAPAPTVLCVSQTRDMTACSVVLFYHTSRRHAQETRKLHTNDRENGEALHFNDVPFSSEIFIFLFCV